jgi:hypothetical protein
VESYLTQSEPLPPGGEEFTECSAENVFEGVLQCVGRLKSLGEELVECCCATTSARCVA